MKRLIFFLILFFISASSYGQVRNVFSRLTRADGLNTNKVNCVWQDKKGFYWVGTENGIQRFDGKKFINLGWDNSSDALPTLGIDQIIGSDTRKLWIRQGNKIGLFDPVTFMYTNVPLKPSKKLPPQTESKLYIDSKNNVFLCVRDYLLMIYNPRQNAFTDMNFPVKVPKNWTFNYIFENPKTNNYWLCSDNGLALYNNKTGNLNFRNHNPDNIPLIDRKDLKYVFDFFIDKQDRWWISYWNESPRTEGTVLLMFNPETKESIADTSNSNLRAGNYKQLDWIVETSNNIVWSGGINTLLSYEPNNNGFFENVRANSKEFDLNCREIKHLFEDREANLWLSTNNGLYVIVKDQQSVYNYVFQEDNVQDIIVRAILETKDKENWIGTFGNGILLFNDKFKKINTDLYKNVTNRNCQYVYSINQHSLTGLIWVGCRNGFILIFDPILKKVVKELNPLSFRNNVLREGGAIKQIIEDSQGDLWFSTEEGRLIKWQHESAMDNNSFKIVKHYQTPILIFIDKQNRIWTYAHNKGLFIMDSTGTKELKHFEKMPEPSSVLGNKITDFEQYNDSIFFISNGFLNILNFKSGEIRCLTQKDGLPGTKVSKLMLDKMNLLWFTSNNGLGSYNLEKNIFATYSNKNGLVYAEKQAYAKYYMQNGEIWFGGENSLYGFIPNELKQKSIPQNVTITDFKIFNTFMPLDSLLSLDEIVLQPQQNSVTFYFSSLSYSQQDKLVYYYKMEGISDNWIKAEQNMLVNFTVLPPGNYTFSVKCVNMQGEESPEITSVKLRILPHFYQTSWFMLLVIISVFSIVFLIFRLRMTRLLAVERVRNKVARDLHDDIGSTLSTINILSSMAKTKLLTDPVKTSDYISKITDNSQQMMDAMDDIVWSIKPDNDNMLRVVARMREYASGILEPKDIEITMNVDEKIHQIKLNMEARRDLYLLFKEAINNAAKYARCTSVEINLFYNHHKIVMRINDNGIGFDLRTNDNGNGLGNMHKRAKRLKGELSISSNSEIGTELTLIVPVSK